MKKILLFTVSLLLMTTGLFAQTRLGAQLGYGSATEQWGAGANAEIFINDKMAISPDLLLYFPEKKSGVRYSFWEINANFHYYVLSEDVVGLYGLAGLNFITSREKFESSIVDDYDNSNTDLGLNLGIGLNVVLGELVPYAELKYVVGNVDQAVVMAGVKIQLFDY
jgi:outer membrane immunogenic protein